MQKATSIGVAAEPAEGSADASARAAELARRYARLIRFAIARVGGDRAEVVGDDVEQRVLMQVLRQLDGEQTIRHPSSYVYRVAVRETVRMLRGEVRAEQTRDAVKDLPRPTVRDPERALASRQLMAQVGRALGSLAEDRRRAVRAHLAGFDVREIMRMYDWSYGRARNLIGRGMADLRRALRELGVDG